MKSAVLGKLAVVFVIILTGSAMTSFSVAPGPTTSPVTCGALTPDVHVSIENFFFSPSTIKVEIGVNNTVQWTNNGVTHTVTANGGAFNSGDISPGGTFTCTFNQAGTFLYHCVIHPSMTGEVDVVGSGGTTTSTTSASTTTSTSSSPPPPKLPSGIVAWVPIGLTNLQGRSTTTSLPVLIDVNSSKYKVYESPTLQNVEFFSKTGTVLTSWLESGNSYNAESTLYWVRLPTPIRAGGSIGIFLGFADSSVTLMTGMKVGEAPQLSPTYGLLDNGKRIFRLYDNFLSGELTGGWIKNLGGGSFSISNSLSVSFGSSPGVFLSHRTFGKGTSTDALVTSFKAGDALGYLNILQPLSSHPASTPAWAGAFILSGCTKVYPDQLNSTGEANNCGSTDGVFFSGSNGPAGVFTIGVIDKVHSFQTINYSAGPTTQPLANGQPRYPAGVGVAGQNSMLTIQWIRDRNSPPGGVMPTVSFGAPGVRIQIAKGASSQGNGQFYVPQTINVTAGTTVYWVNKDLVAHTVTSNSPMFSSGSIPSNGFFAFTFSGTGTFAYHCSFHSWMTGTITAMKS